jgi:hypothetical protein
MASKPIQQQSSTIINEPIKLTKRQNEILTMVCDLYEMEVGEYIKDALIEKPVKKGAPFSMWSTKGKE